MTKEEKAKFITDMLENLRDDLLSKVDKMPDDWDGWELRQIIADRATGFVWSDTKSHRTRKRKYNNDVLVNNL